MIWVKLQKFKLRETLRAFSSAFAAVKSGETHKCNDPYLENNFFNGPQLQITAELAEIKNRRSPQRFIERQAERIARTKPRRNEVLFIYQSNCFCGRSLLANCSLESYWAAMHWREAGVKRQIARKLKRSYKR